MSPARRQTVSALVAATAAFGLPAANAFATLPAKTPKTTKAKPKPRPKPVARPAVPPVAPSKGPTTITTGSGTYTLGPPLDLLPQGGTQGSGATGDRTFVGAAGDVAGYGPITVTIVVSNGKIVDAGAEMPTGAARSAYINARVGPYLNREVVQNQGTKVDLVSGATRTCQGYAQSLQSALDQAGIRASVAIGG